jgi:hypothetical protein
MCRLEAAVSLILTLSLCVEAQTITGIVIEDHSGNPVTSADVQVVRAGASDLVADLESDSGGHFELPPLAAGDYRIKISKPNYVAAVLELHGPSGGSKPLVARLVRCGVITGHVLDSAGQPVADATVFAVSRVANGVFRPFARNEQGHQAQVDAQGQYRLFNLPPGEYGVAVTYGASTQTVGSTGDAHLGASGSGVVYYPRNSQPRLFSIKCGTEYSDIDFSLTPGTLCRVSGKVETASPQAGFWLGLTSIDQPSFATAVAQADANGEFHFEGVPTGSYTLFASGPSTARGGLGAELDKHPMFGRMQVEVETNVDGIVIPVREGRLRSFIFTETSGAQGCPSVLDVRFSSLEDWAADLDRTVKIGLDKPQQVDSLAPGRYVVESAGSAADCYIAKDTLVDLSSADNKPITIQVRGGHDAPKQ